MLWNKLSEAVMSSPKLSDSVKSCQILWQLMLSRAVKSCYDPVKSSHMLSRAVTHRHDSVKSSYMLSWAVTHYHDPVKGCHKLSPVDFAKAISTIVKLFRVIICHQLSKHVKGCHKLFQAATQLSLAVTSLFCQDILQKDNKSFIVHASEDWLETAT